MFKTSFISHVDFLCSFNYRTSNFAETGRKLFWSLSEVPLWFSLRWRLTSLVEGMKFSHHFCKLVKQTRKLTTSLNLIKFVAILCMNGKDCRKIIQILSFVPIVHIFIRFSVHGMRKQFERFVNAYWIPKNFLIFCCNIL